MSGKKKKKTFFGPLFKQPCLANRVNRVEPSILNILGPLFEA